MKELEFVAATRDLEDGLIKAGYEGTIVHVYEDPEGYEVDFEVEDGWELVTCNPEDIAPLKEEPLRKIA
ncbi:hypothetical protein MASR1M90_14360 [Desulfovibrionales bacterium]